MYKITSELKDKYIKLTLSRKEKAIFSTLVQYLTVQFHMVGGVGLDSQHIQCTS